MARHPAFEHVAHRPWPHPVRPWTWRQSWLDLLFAHWPLPPEAVRPLLPPGVEVDTFEGETWVAVVPFHMAGVMRRPLPDLPWISAFPELNLRLYVTRDGQPGVWFLSLDASNPLAVWAARTFFYLPYVHSRMSVVERPEGIVYRSERKNTSPPVRFEATYRPTGAPYLAAPGTLEHWFTERYALYAQSRRGRLYRAEVHHAPWPLQPAEATISRNDLLAPHGLTLPDRPPILHFARRLDVVVWGLERV